MLIIQRLLLLLLRPARSAVTTGGRKNPRSVTLLLRRGLKAKLLSLLDQVGKELPVLGKHKQPIRPAHTLAVLGHIQPFRFFAEELRNLVALLELAQVMLQVLLEIWPNHFLDQRLERLRRVV